MGIPNEEVENITQQYLDEAEENIEIELAEFITDGWVINDKDTASKIDYFIHKLEEKIEEDESIAANQKAPLQAKIDKLEEGKARLDEWLDRSTKVHRNRIQDLKTHLHLYHQRVIEAEEIENEKRIADGKKPLKISKSIKLTYHDLTSKKQQPEIVKNEEELLKWVEENQSNTISFSELSAFLKEKEDKAEFSITIDELLHFVENAESEYIKRNPVLAWGEFKKTLRQVEVDVVEVQNDKEVVTGKKLVYYDQNGQEVPHIELIERGIQFDWKQVKEKS